MELPKEKLLWKKDVARIINRSGRTVMRYVERKLLPESFRVKNHPCWHRETIEAWLANQGKEANHE